MTTAQAAPRLDSTDILKPLIDCVSDPLLIVEPQNLRCLEVNQRAAALLGRSEPELLSLGLDKVVDQQGAETLRDMACLRQKLATRHVNFLSNQGEARSVEICARALSTGSDRAVLLLMICDQRINSTPDSARPETQTNRVEREDLIETTVDFPTIIGLSPQIHDVCRLIGLVAKTNTTVLIQGESGTGKELVAQAVHFHSHRSRNPLIKVNCAALTETLLESELFGHKKGSFTGAIQDRKGRFKLADGGTIILDEIGSMSLSGQAKLLRVLQEKEFEPVGDSLTVKVDVRVIAITNTDMMKAIDQGTFREDLYYRLNAFPIQLPPLRDRKVDIPMIARHFLKEYTVSLKRQVSSVDPRALSMLMDYAWPGNVRELENAIEYAVILEKGDRLSASSLPEKLRRDSDRKSSLKERLELVEKQMILEALSATDWVKNRAAQLLGIDRRNLSYFLHKHGIH
jgi:transcriptional regulator with PAS, ATPase and Fis domain